MALSHVFFQIQCLCLALFLFVFVFLVVVVSFCLRLHDWQSDSSWLSCVILNDAAVHGVSVPFPFDVSDRMLILVVSVPDHRIFICFIRADKDHAIFQN